MATIEKMKKIMLPFSKAVSKRYPNDNFINKIISLYQQNLTKQDMQKLSKFYDTPIGKKR